MDHPLNTIRHEPPRPLADDERDALECLLARDFPGAEALRVQAQTLRVIEETRGRGILLRLEVAEGSPAATVTRGIPVEAEGEAGPKGVSSHVLLHVKDGQISELECHREDLLPMQGFPDTTGLKVFP